MLGSGWPGTLANGVTACFHKKGMNEGTDTLVVFGILAKVVLVGIAVVAICDIDGAFTAAACYDGGSTMAHVGTEGSMAVKGDSAKVG